MIEEIHLRDLGVITDARLPLEPGFSVLTGETGAGKTMVVTALGLLLGARSDASSVRQGAPKALAEAVLKLPEGHPALALAEEAGASSEDLGEGTRELLLARTVSASGRSRAHLGGISAPIGTLAKVGQQLVAVHGQSDQLRLKDPAEQRQALDAYAGEALAELLASYQANYQRYRQLGTQLRDMRENSRARALEAQTLAGALKEIDSVAPQDGEEESLRAESQKLTNLESLRQATALASAALSGSDYQEGEASNVLALLDAARAALVAQAEADQDLKDLADRLAEALIQVTDIAADISSYASGLDFEGPQRLAEVEARRAQLKNLTRKYGADIAEVLAWAQESRQRLESLVDDPDRQEQLEAELVAFRQTLTQQAQDLTALRREAADRLAAAVSQELTALAMPNASLVVEVAESEKFSIKGKDTVSFLLPPTRRPSPVPWARGHQVVSSPGSCWLLK